MTDSTFVSTTIPYVNAEPHVGFALELVQTDALCRYLRLTGNAVHSSTGSDDHSLKNVRAAEARGEPVRELVRRNAAAFAELRGALCAEFDEDVSTSVDPRHAPSVERLLRALQASGDVYARRYRGAYCVGCEQFYRSEELVAGVCPEHERAPEIVEEQNWFFRLSRYEERLRRAIQSNALRIFPQERKNEVLGFLDSGLEDFSISRSAERARGFGLTVPGDPSQVVYVWVDALCNYLSAGGYGELGSDCGWQRAARRVHVLGKGVLRFHAVYWPALLLSAGLELPNELRVHGYLTVEGKKIGKSLGNALDPRALCNEVGVNALRYYLLRHISPFKDADFSRERLIAAHDAELADELGNLALRVLTLVERHCAGRAPELDSHALGEAEQSLNAVSSALPARLAAAFADHQLSDGLDAVWDLVRAANRYVDRNEPWRLARRLQEPGVRARLETVLSASLSALRILALALTPFVPELATRLAGAVGVRSAPGTLANCSLLAHTPRGEQLGPATPLVPRLRPRAGRT
ncbi:MAG TPA: methionine--tRNA ligase [Polyangiaceae bacterium]|nr:methionine--tRNA ligase [Polyangiaceae bacterium]